MRTDVLAFYGLKRALLQRSIGYYETQHHQQLLRDIHHAVHEASLIILSGVIGVGKSLVLDKLKERLAAEGEMLVSRVVTVETQKITLGTLITALFCDLFPGRKRPEIPKQSELRERKLLELIQKRGMPVVLFVDEAHELRHSTLTELKRLTELVSSNGHHLAVLLAGHPKLRNDLRRPEMEEVGLRTTMFSLDGVTGSQRDYIQWLIGACAKDGVTVDDVLTPEALDFLASRLRTPLQIAQHLTLALEIGYLASMKPITEAVIDDVLSKRLDDLGPTLIRHGYTVKVLCEMFGAKPAEIKALMRQTLDPERAQELRDQMLAAGLPV